MAGLNPTLGSSPSTGRRAANTAVNLPRLVMSWEDWLTFAAMVVAFGAVAVSIEQADWVNNMPRVVPTIVAGLVVGLVAARVRVNSWLIQPFVLLAGTLVVIAAVQNYADGATFQDRLSDFWTRMREWWAIVRSGGVSNDNLPFVTLVHGMAFLAAYFAAWSIYRWHNPWIALVPGGFLLLTNISFMDDKPTGTLVIFLLGAMFIVARSHLQKCQARWKQEGTEYPEFISLNALNVTFLVIISVLIVAWQVPIAREANSAETAVNTVTRPFRPLTDDLTRLFHNLDGGAGQNLHSFGATLPIQGDIELGTKVLFEVTSGQAGFIRGTSYDEYTGVGWKATGRQDERVEAGEQALESYQARSTSVLRVTVQSDESTLLTLGTPLGTNLDAIVDAVEGNQGDIEQIRSQRGLDEGDTYNAVGSVSIATPDELRAAGTEYPPEIAGRYLQLPDDVPDRVHGEALRVTEGATNPFDQAILIQQYLRGFPYDLTVPAAPPGEDVADYLLFTLRRGHFDYMSTTMAVMLRELGVPARVAVGYVLDPANAEQSQFTVRKNNAYSWVEVFFPGYGWVEFNPTADRPPVGAAAGGTGTGTVAPPLAPTEIEGNLEELLSGIDLGAAGSDPVAGVALNEEAIDAQGPPWMLIWGLAAAALVVAVIALSGRMAWTWGLGGLEGRARMWAQTQKLAGWAGLGANPTETPREWSRRAGSAVNREEQANTLADAYQETRYGRPDLQRVDDEDAEAAYRGLRGALLSKVTRWKRPAKKQPE